MLFKRNEQKTNCLIFMSVWKTQKHQRRRRRRRSRSQQRWQLNHSWLNTGLSATDSSLALMKASDWTEVSLHTALMSHYPSEATTCESHLTFRWLRAGSTLQFSSSQCSGDLRQSSKDHFYKLHLKKCLIIILLGPETSQWLAATLIFLHVRFKQNKKLTLVTSASQHLLCNY